MRLENLLDTPYYENFIKRLQEFPTTAANFTFQGKHISEIANVFRLCFEAKRNWMPSYDEKALTAFFEKDNNLHYFQKELLLYVKELSSKREWHEKLEQEDTYPATMDCRSFNFKAGIDKYTDRFDEFMAHYRKDQNVDHIFNFIENGYKLCT